MDKRTVSRRDFLRVSALTAAGAALSACGPTPTPQNVRETVEVTVPVEQTVVVTQVVEPTVAATPAPTEPVNLVWMSGDLAVFENVDTFLAENPDVAKVDVIAWDATREKAMFAAGSPPDVIYTSCRQIPYYVRLGLWLNLDPFIEVDDVITWDNMEPVYAWAKYDGLNMGQGSVYNIIVAWCPDFSNFVDPPMLEEVGLSVPSLTDPLKYADIPAMAEALVKREGDRTVRFGISPTYNYLIDRLCQFACMEAGTTLYDEYMSKISLVDNEPARNVLQWVYTLSEQRLMPSTIDPMSGWPAQLWTQGQAGILAWIGYWFSGAIRMWAPDDPAVAALMDRVEMIPAFTWSGQQHNPSSGATSHAIPKVCRYPEQAWKLLKFDSGDGELAVTRAKSGWGLPALKSMMQYVPAETDFDKRMNAAVDEAIKYSDPMGIQVNPYYNTDSMGDFFWAEMDRGLTGAITFDDVVKNLEDKVNQAIVEGLDAQT